MGTRYERGDFVFLGNSLAEVTGVRQPDSSSPTYELNYVNSEDQATKPEDVKASALEKADLGEYHPDGIIIEIESAAKEIANRHAAIVYSDDTRDVKQEVDMIVAKFGDIYGVDGHDTQKTMPDTSGMKEVSKYGGGIPSTEQEVDLQEAIRKASKEGLEGVSRETVDRIAEAEYGHSTGMIYLTVSGKSMYFKEAGDTVAEQNAADVEKKRNRGNPVSDMMDSR